TAHEPTLNPPYNRCRRIFSAYDSDSMTAEEDPRIWYDVSWAATFMAIACVVPSDLSVFFHDTTAWGWPDAPLRPLWGALDPPNRPKRVPRCSPTDQLARLMAAVRALSCPYRRGALLIARWSGARRGAVQRLDLDCLDTYPYSTRCCIRKP